MHIRTRTHTHINVQRRQALSLISTHFAPMLPAIAAFRVKGLCAATYTAFNDDSSINFDAIPAQIAELKRGGVTSVFGAFFQ